MSKFNDATSGKRKTVNKAGGSAYEFVNMKEKLMTQVLTTFFKEPKYYGDNSNEIVKTIRLVVKNDPKFVANLAIYAREVFYLRSISHVLVAELAHAVEGKPYVRKVLKRVCQRADDMTEILAYYIGTYGKPIPNSLKKGLADAVKKFDEYQLAKYDRQHAVTLKDIICLARPKGTTVQHEMWKRLIEGNLATPITWETQISTRGNKAEVWEQLISEQKLPYMATLRNLRNIVQAKVKSTVLDTSLNYLTNAKAVAGSKQMPFRFLSAYREMEHGVGGSKVLDAIETALELSVENMPKFEGTTFLTADNSGSMDSRLSAKSTVSYNDVATLLMSISQKFCSNAITSVFGENFQVVNVSKKNGIIGNMNVFKKTNVGHSTNAWKAIEYLIKNKVFVDRIVIFSDMQVYNSYAGWGYSRNTGLQGLVEQYRKEVNPNVWVHSVDLAGYGTQQFVGKNTNLLAGWNDKMLPFMKLAEEGTTNLLKAIENYA